MSLRYSSKNLSTTLRTYRITIINWIRKSSQIGKNVRSRERNRFMKDIYILSLHLVPKGRKKSHTKNIISSTTCRRRHVGVGDTAQLPQRKDSLFTIRNTSMLTPLLPLLRFVCASYFPTISCYFLLGASSLRGCLLKNPLLYVC